MQKKQNKIDFSEKLDPSRMVIQNVSPPDRSIYSNPTTQNLEVVTPSPDMKRRSPSGGQVGYNPNMKNLQQADQNVLSKEN